MLCCTVLCVALSCWVRCPGVLCCTVCNKLSGVSLHPVSECDSVCVRLNQACSGTYDEEPDEAKPRELLLNMIQLPISARQSSCQFQTLVDAYFAPEQLLDKKIQDSYECRRCKV